MIYQFINKLPFADKVIFWAGKFFNRIGNFFLSYKDYKFWQPHFNRLVLNHVKVQSDGKLLQYYFNDLNIYSRIYSSDSQVFDLVMLDEEYKAATDIFLLNNIPLNIYMDLGSNIGLTTLFVKKLFPDCKVVALEPDENNFLMIKKNVEANHLTNVHLVKGGVGKRDCFLVDDGGIRNKMEWAHSFKEVEEPTGIPSYSISTLMKKFSFDEIDFLKIDVEGAEKEIFSEKADVSFLQKVKVMALEIHDEFNIRSKIYSILKENDFIIFNSGETTIAAKRSLFK